MTLQGKTDEALARYTDIIARTDNPEFMDAVAGIHRAAGRTEADRARTVALAEAHHRTRPNAEAKISLARAHLRAGRTDDARKSID